MYHTGKVVTRIKLAIYTYPENGEGSTVMLSILAHYTKNNIIFIQTEYYISLTSNTDLKLASLSLR